MDFELQGRSTGKGAFTDATIVVEDQIRQPDHTESSRTGNHWKSVWRNLPDGAMIFYLDVTNSGKEYRSIEIIKDDEATLFAEWEQGQWSNNEAPTLWEQFTPG